MTSSQTMDRQTWLLLIFLSVIWGGSFFFVAAAVLELPPFTIVLARVGLAAVFLYPVFKLRGGTLPATLKGWWPFFVMSLFNNVIPFSFFVNGQTHVTGGLAAVLNATTPLFTVLILAAFGDEKLTAHRIVGVIIGLAGVAVLRGASLSISSGQTIGMLLCLGGAVAYGFAGLWGRRKLKGVPPITSAVCQLICSTAVISVIAAAVEQPWTLPFPTLPTIAALVGLALISTSLGYVVFFTILARAGATNVALVTLLIPVSAILLGVWFLDEPLTVNEVIGALIIAASLIVIDGRAFTWIRGRVSGA